MAGFGFDGKSFIKQAREYVARHPTMPVASPPAPAKKRKSRSASAKKAVTAAPTPPIGDLGWHCPYCRGYNTRMGPTSGGSVECDHCHKPVSVDHL